MNRKQFLLALGGAGTSVCVASPAFGRRGLPGPDNPLGFAFTDAVGCREGQRVLLDAVARDPGCLAGVGEVTLTKVCDAAEKPMQHRDAAPAELAGAHAKFALRGRSGAILLWGPYAPLPAGRHLVVYRFRLMEPAGDARCFVDVAHDAVTFSGRRPGAEEVGAGWTEIAVPVDAPREMEFEFRFWPGGREVGLDRIYVYRLGDDPGARRPASVMGAVGRTGFYLPPRRKATAGALLERAGGRIPLAHEEVLGLWSGGDGGREFIDDASEADPVRGGDLLWVPERQAVGQLRGRRG